MTKPEIIKETAAFYNSGNRSFIFSGVRPGDETCQYLGDEGKRCALSRCCIDSPKVNAILDYCEEKDAHYIIKTSKETGVEIFKPEYCGHEDDFWGDIQSLHDEAKYWNEKGLTDAGMEKKENLLYTYREE